jgi:hypothetical protein
VLIELVQRGLVIARNEYRDNEEGAVEVTRMWITDAGKRVFVARDREQSGFTCAPELDVAILPNVRGTTSAHLVARRGFDSALGGGSNSMPPLA